MCEMRAREKRAREEANGSSAVISECRRLPRAACFTLTHRLSGIALASCFTAYSECNDWRQWWATDPANAQDYGDVSTCQGF